MAPDPPDRARVAIVGGGPAGSTLGRILAGWGVDALVVDAGPPRHGGEVLGPEAALVLEKLALPELFAHRTDLARGCGGIVTRWASGRRERFDHRAGSQAWAVNRTPFAEALRALAIEAGCRWIEGRVVGRPQRVDDDYVLAVRSPGEAEGLRLIRAAFVVDASGHRAQVARCLGARRRIDDRLVAIVAHVADGLARNTDDGDGNALRDPPLAIGLLADGWTYRVDAPGRVTQAFITDARVVTDGRAGLRTAFHRATRAINPHGASPAASLQLLDASSAALESCTGVAWLAVGDAAASLDPFTGQGLAQALGSALAAAHALHRHWRGDLDALPAYAGAMDASYRHSRHGLRLHYAYRAEQERTAFWRSRAECAASARRLRKVAVGA